MLAAVMLGLLPVPAQAAEVAVPGRRTAETAEKVLVFSLPRVTWADFAEAELPHLTELFSHGMVAQLSPRTAGSRTMAADGYATIGAGNRADGAADELLGGNARDRDERVDGRAAYQAYEVRTGLRPRGAVLHLDIAGVRAENDKDRYGAVPGSLGSALGEAGRTTAVIGNADAHGVRDRSAALAMMDTDGVADGGTVSAELNMPDPLAPYGYRQNPAATADAFRTAWQARDVTLVEASDLERVDAFEPYALPEAWQAMRRQALERADELLGELLRSVDLSRHMVMVVTPAVPRAGEQLGVFGMAGPGIDQGVAVSGTTRRPGYLTLPDIAPTILERLNVPAPPAVTGTPITLGQARPVNREMIDEYVRANEVAVFRDKVTGPVTVVFIVLQLLAYLFASLMLILRARRRPGARRRRFSTPRWRRATRFLLLTVLALPTTTFLSGLLPYDRLGPIGYVAGLVLAAAGLAAGVGWIGWAARHRLPTAAPVLPPLLLVTLTWITMIVDVLFYTGRLQLDTVFGYSPIVAGRFSGYGNFAFSLVAICAVIMVTGGWAIAALSRHRAEPTEASPEPAADNTGPIGETAEQSGGPADGAADAAPKWRIAALLVVAALLVFTVVVDGYPAYGSDIGGVLAAVPSFALVLLLLAGVRVTWRRLLLVGLGTVAVLAAFAVVDLARPAEERTHLGRMVQRISDTGGLATIIERKLFANLSILTHSIWVWVVPLATAFLIVLAMRRFGTSGSALRQLCQRIPGMTACLWGAAVVALLGFALNDSGIAVPAMMSTILLPYLGYLVFRGEEREAATAPEVAEVPAKEPATQT